MVLFGNDCWCGVFWFEWLGWYVYVVVVWCDVFGIYWFELEKKYIVGVDVMLELEEGVCFVVQVVEYVFKDVLVDVLYKLVYLLVEVDYVYCFKLLLDFVIVYVMIQVLYYWLFYVESVVYLLDVECVGVVFVSWYELFFCLVLDDEQWYGIFDDVICWLGVICGMGFDVLYFLFIYLIGCINCKGCNNSLCVEVDDFGSLYVIGVVEGGYDVIYLQFGMLEDFCCLVCVVCEKGLELVLDFVI